MSISAFAGGASDALQEILKQKFLEIVQRQRQEVAMRGLDQEAQRDAANRELGFGNLGMRQKEYEASQKPAPPTKARPMVVSGRLIDPDTGKAIYEPPVEQKPEPPVRPMALAPGARLVNPMTGQLIYHAPDRPEKPSSGAGAVQADVKQQQEANEVQQTLDLISRLREDKARPIATGPLEGRGLGRLKDNSGYERVKALHDQLVGRLQLAQAGKLKGQGQVSDREREMLMKAATALTRNLADQDYVNELANVETILRGKLGSGGAAPAQNNDPLGLFKK
jgi:hypothetical protein